MPSYAVPPWIVKLHPRRMEWPTARCLWSYGCYSYVSRAGQITGNHRPPLESSPASAPRDSCLSPSRSRRLKTSAAVSWSMSMLSDWSNFWNSLKANLSSPLESCWRSNLSMLRPLCSLIAFSTWRTSSTEGLAAAHNSSQLIFPFPFWSMKAKTLSARAAWACIPTFHLDSRCDDGHLGNRWPLSYDLLSFFLHGRQPGIRLTFWRTLNLKSFWWKTTCNNWMDGL